MTVRAASAAIGRRPAAVWITVGVLNFLGVTAMAGGLAMLLGIGAAPPDEWLAAIPLIDSWVIPGLVLAGGFGLGSLLAAFGMLRRTHWAWLDPIERATGHHWSWLAAIVIGLGQLMWIILELVYLLEPSALQLVYGAVGLALLLLPLHPAVDGHLAAGEPSLYRGEADRALGVGLTALTAVIAATAVLGPFVTGAIRYHTSATTLNQVIGGDAAALLVVAPVCLAIAVLAMRGHRAAPALALAPGLFAAYTYTQLIVGEEYLRLPGNNERFFPLLYAGFLLGGLVAVTAWRHADPAAVPAPVRRMERTAAMAMFAVALFLPLQHLPTLADALRDNPARTEYLSSPTAFWLVKLMDLGILAPAALAAGIGLLRGRAWARRAAYAIVGAYTLIGASVTGMAITMYVNDDPDSSPAFAAGFAVLTLIFAALAVGLYRPIFHSPVRSRPAEQIAAPPRTGGLTTTMKQR